MRQRGPQRLGHIAAKIDATRHDASVVGSYERRAQRAPSCLANLTNVAGDRRMDNDVTPGFPCGSCWIPAEPLGAEFQSQRFAGPTDRGRISPCGTADAKIRRI